MISRVLLGLFFLVLLVISNGVSSEARHHRHTAVVVGTVVCDTCSQQELSKASHFISGATVAVECREGRKGPPRFHREVKTNDRGEFTVSLPLSVAKKLRGCSVKLISGGDGSCASVAAVATAGSFVRLESRRGRSHVFSAGAFTFRPEVCDRKKTDESVSPVIDPLVPILPPIPEVPGVPQLPVPVIGPGNPLIPPAATEKVGVDQLPIFPPLIPIPPNPLLPPPTILPPNPLLPPPSIIPPVIPTPPPSIFPPLFPSPPPSIFPPIIPSPPSPPPSIFPPLFPAPPTPPPSIFPPLRPIFPPIPGLIPSPPPPPPPAPTFPVPLPPLPFPLPPFPFQPSPGNPPPAVTSSSAQKNP